MALPSRAAPRWLDRGIGSLVIDPRGRTSGGWTECSDLRWLDCVDGSAMVGLQGRFSGGWTAGSDLVYFLLLYLFNLL